MLDLVLIHEELGRLWQWEERHRRLLARISIALLATLLVDLLASILVLVFERHAKGTDVHGYTDALYFSTVQLLTVSSSLENPITSGGRTVNIVLELWGVGVVTAVAGSFAAFFHAGDSS